MKGKTKPSLIYIYPLIKDLLQREIVRVDGSTRDAESRYSLINLRELGQLFPPTSLPSREGVSRRESERERLNDNRSIFTADTVSFVKSRNRD